MSAIGAGINATITTCAPVSRSSGGLDLALLGLSTSSFRISSLIDESGVDEAVRALHRELVERT